MMNGPSQQVKAKRIKKADHTVVIPANITTTDDIVWMSKGHKLTFEHQAEFELEFDSSPEAPDKLRFKSAQHGDTHRVVINLKQVTNVTACKYTIIVGANSHDPIVIIDPN